MNYTSGSRGAVRRDGRIIVVMRNVERVSCNQVNTLKVVTRVDSDLQTVLFIDFFYRFPRKTHLFENIILFLITFINDRYLFKKRIIFVLPTGHNETVSTQNLRKLQ